MPNKYYETADINTFSVGDRTDISRMLTSNLQGVFGIPYQFLSSVDQRIPDSEIGAMYAEKIVSKMPLLFLTPCRQKFMPGFSSEDRGAVLESLVGPHDAVFNNNMQGGKYYTTEFAYADYYRYVNTMCSQEAYFANQSEAMIPMPNGGRSALKNVDWSKMKNSAFNNYFAADQAVVFYLDGLVTVSDSFSNSTTESSLANSINGFRDQANELKFLVGENSAVSKLMQTAGEVGDNFSSGLSNVGEWLAGGMLGDLMNTGVNTVLQGGKLVFPKIWQDSSYDRSSFSFTIKLRSPDHDTLSILLNVIVPYLHLVAMVLPIGLEENANGFNSPFLVKAYCKGMFNIDMGIITNLSATRGEKCQWNDDGLPTQIDVDITIEDLYSSLFMTPEGADDGSWMGKQIYHVTRNTAMMDYLANMAGLNIAEQEIARSWRMYTYLMGTEIGRVPSNLWSKFDTGVANLMAKLYR